MNLINRIFSMRRFSFLLQQLVHRDFKIRYRGSFLGILWSVLNPLLNMLVLSIVFSQIFRAVDNYKMYLLSGLTLFNFFSEATNLALNSVVMNFGLITKVYFPKSILPISKVLSTSINLGITTIVFLVLGSFMGVTPWIGYLIIPFVLICLMVFACGISFILAASQVFFRDTQHLYSVLVMIWMYATPILYPIESIAEVWQPYFKANPMYIFIDFLRQVTLYGTMPTWQSFALCTMSATLAFFVGIIVFVKTQSKFIYYT